MKTMLFAILALSIACTNAPGRPTARSTASISERRISTRRAVLEEIQLRVAESRDLRRELTRPPGPNCPDPPALCADVCEIGERLCDDARDICAAAHQIEHAWADDKCRDAQAWCRGAAGECGACGHPGRPWPMVF